MKGYIETQVVVLGTHKYTLTSTHEHTHQKPKNYPYGFQGHKKFKLINKLDLF